LLIVLVLAAVASFPNQVLSDDDQSPQGEWTGPAHLPHTHRGHAPTAGHSAGRLPARQLKIHSWI
jgi:hypothetical protein